MLGAAAGLEPAELHRIIRASSGGPYAALAPLLLGRDFDDVIFRLDIATKDLTLAVEAAAAQGVDDAGQRGRPRRLPRRDPVGIRAQGVPRHVVATGTSCRRRRAAAADEDAAPSRDRRAPSPSTSRTTRRSATGSRTSASRWLRDHDPVSWHPPTPRTPDGEGFWVVTRHADVSTVLRDPVTFSSDRGGIREQGRHGDQGRAHRRHDAQPDRRPAAPTPADARQPRLHAARRRRPHRRAAPPRRARCSTPPATSRSTSCTASPASCRRRRSASCSACRPTDQPALARLARRRHRGRLAVDPLARRDAPDPRLRRRPDRRQAGPSRPGDHVDDRPRPRRCRLEPHRRRADRLLRPAVPGRRRDDAQRHRRRRARLRRAPGRARPAARRPDAAPDGHRGDRPLDDAVGLQAAHRQPRRRAGRRADRAPATR